MKFNLSEYWDLLTQYTNPVKILSSAIIYAILAGISVILILIFLRKRILVKRKYRLLKVLAISYFFVLPLVAGFFGFKWGLVKGVRSDIKEHLIKNTQDLNLLLKNSITNDSTYASLVGNTLDSLNFSTNDVANALSIIYYTQYVRLLEETSKSQNSLKKNSASLLYMITKDYDVGNKTKKGIQRILNEQLKFDEDITQQAMNTKLNELFDNGLFSKILGIQIDKFLGKVQNNILLLFGIILLFPVVEIIIANRINKTKLPH